MEVKSATGGAESSLFAEDLLNAYRNYCDNNNLEFISIEYDATEANGKKGCKSGKFEITGENAYNYFKYESGVHKVQRVPVTESKGRVHSSTCTVAIFKVKKEDFVEEDIDERDLKYEFMRAGGAGGQHVNKTESACRITHIPSGISVYNADTRDQFMNKLKAFSVLKERLSNSKKDNFVEGINSTRKSQTGTGNLSEKIRTYNFPDSRVTDHRLGVTKYGIDKMFNGNMLDEFVKQMHKKEREEYIKKVMEDRMKEIKI